MSNPVTEYLRQIGAKGGSAGRGPSKARSSDAARAAVQARWAKAKRAKKRKTRKPNAAAVGRRDSDVPTSGLLADESKGETR